MRFRPSDVLNVKSFLKGIGDDDDLAPNGLVGNGVVCCGGGVAGDAAVVDHKCHGAFPQLRASEHPYDAFPEHPYDALMGVCPYDALGGRALV